jgi:diguanylate cyclase (GGDEF)-like protein/PAS domain S-box-containing protein
LTRKFPLHDARGEVYGVGGISTDITHIKAQQRQTLLSEAVFMSSQDAIIVTDPETCIVRVNPAFTRQTGFSAESVLGEKTRLLKSGRQDAGFYTEMWKALHDKGQWSGEINNRRADGTFYSVWSTINMVRDTDGTLLHYIAVQTDVTALHNAQVALARQAAYDTLTGLPNRTLFNDRITQLVAMSKRQQRSFSLLFIDLDRFKEVNDTLGHLVGDGLLREIGRRLQLGVRAEDTVARIGGDEFVVLLPNADQKGAHNLAGLLLQRLNEPFMLQQATPYRPMASVGLATYPHDGQTPDELLRSADLAMYDAKLGGRNRTATYVVAMSQANDQSFEIQTDLAQAVALNQLRVYFQPKCRMADGALMGAEVLVRWERPGHGLVRPGEFIGIAERAGLLVELDRWVMRASLQQLGPWIKSGQWQTGWRLAVNQNVVDLQQPTMVEDLRRLLQLHQVAAGALELEITEDALMEPTPVQLSHLQELRQMGITLAIDDFGTRYSSLAYLRQLPVSVIKIDQQFVASMLTQNSDTVLVRTIIEMAHNLGHTVVAEGIESVEQQAELMRMGAEYGQGYLFGYPVNADEFAARWLRPARQVKVSLDPISSVCRHPS